MTRNLRRNMKPAGETAVPEEQVVIYQTCACCKQSIPIEEFDKRGRWRQGQKPTDSVCRFCRDIQTKETRKYVRRHSQRVDEMMLTLCESLAEEPMTDFEDLPNIGTLTQAVLRPFGGAQGIALQMAGTFLSSPPGSAVRQKMLSLLVKMDAEASKQGYAKKPMEMLSDEDLERFIEEKERRLLRVADGEHEEEIPEEEAKREDQPA